MATAKQPIITSTPDVLGGTPVFRGTRVPVQTLIEYLEGGADHRRVCRRISHCLADQVIAFLEEATAKMLPVAS